MDFNKIVHIYYLNPTVISLISVMDHSLSPLVSGSNSYENTFQRMCLALVQFCLLNFYKSMVLPSGYLSLTSYMTSVVPEGISSLM